jgi:muramoyltetrapeptide carboxypeptidase LdcA involved in peptidoglycan recycling
MTTPVIHLLASASTCQPLLGCFKVRSYRRIVELAQHAVGPDYEVTADTALMNPRVDERWGGRRDDERRCRDLQGALADDRTAAIVTLRGGAWFTRLLPRLDFGVLDARRRVVHVFGFSELATLVNIAAAHPMARGYYHHDIGFLNPDPDQWRATLDAYLRQIVDVIEGRPVERPVTGRLVRGTLPRRREIRVVGGCLQVLSVLYGTPFASCLDTAGRWLALEECYDDLVSIDRHLAHLRLAGAFDCCAGVLLGDLRFDEHEGHVDDLTDAVLALLALHLPPGREKAVVAHGNFGHCHPAGLLPLNAPLTMTRGTGADRRQVTITPS